jgi:hypothetical protein
MIETVQEILAASGDSELGALAFLSGFFAFLLIPYAVLALTERATRRKTLVDVVYDGIATITALGVVVMAGVQSGTEGLIAVLVGVSLVGGVYLLLITPIVLIGIVQELASPTPDTAE